MLEIFNRIAENFYREISLLIEGECRIFRIGRHRIKVENIQNNIVFSMLGGA